MHSNELCDIADFHREIGDYSRFSDKPSLQKTWDKLIRFALTFDNKESSTENARTFQRDFLGRLDSNNTLLELLPLPSPKSTDWNYCSFSKLTMLKDRKTYQTFFLDARILKIKDKIKSHKPRVVLFYGFKKYKNELRKFLNVEFSPNKESLDFYHGHVDDTLLLFTNHPTAPGLPSKYFEQIATIARDGIA